MNLDRHVMLKRVEEVVLQLVLDRSIRVSPVEIDHLECQLRHRTRKALDDEERFEELARPEHPRIRHDPAMRAARERRLQQLRRTRSGRGLASVADAMIEILLDSRGVKVLVEVDVLRSTILMVLTRPAAEAPVEPLGGVGFPPMPGPGPGGGSPAEARVSDVPPRPRQPEPEVDRRERKVEGDDDDGWIEGGGNCERRLIRGLRLPEPRGAGFKGTQAGRDSGACATTPDDLAARPHALSTSRGRIGGVFASKSSLVEDGPFRTDELTRIAGSEQQ
jgi:hypothetical protein